MSRFRPLRGRRVDGVELAIGLFAAIQTFVFFARQDRFEILLWWTSESWLYVTLLWIKNLALAAAAFLGFAWLARATGRLAEPDPRVPRARRVLLFAAILAAGVALRWIAVRQIPPGVWADALFEAEGALREPGGIPWLGGRPLAVEGLRQSALVSHLYLKFCELVFAVFGRGDAGLLALSAVGGTLALPAIYWLGTEVAGPRRGLIAMAILAFGAWPLVFSRWAWTAALLLPLVLAAAAAALAARRTRRLAPAVASGFFLGLSLHTHPAAWAVGAGFLAFGLASLKRPLGGRLLAAAAISGLIAFLPFGLALVDHPDRIGGRARDVSFLAPTLDVAVPGGNRPYAPPLRLLYNAIEYSGLLLWTRDPNPRHGSPDRPPLHPVIGVAALVGVALTARSAKEGRAGDLLVLLLAGAALLAGVLGNPGGAPNGLRVYPVVAFVALWAAASFARWIPAAARALPVSPAVLWSLGAVLLLTFETGRFLVAWPREPLVVASFCREETEAGRLRRALGEAPTVLEPGAVAWPIVFETLAAGPDPRVPVRKLPRRTPAELARSSPREPFWYLAKPDGLERLRAAGFRVARGVAVSEAGTVALARVRPPDGR